MALPKRTNPDAHVKACRALRTEDRTDIWVRDSGRRNLGIRLNMLSEFLVYPEKIAEELERSN